MNDNIEDKAPIKLPFEGEQFDIGEWVYAHRIGLCITLIAYLIVAIGFMTIKISLMVAPPPIQTIAIDLQQLAELEREREELIKSIEKMQEENNDTDWSEVQNRASNESAEMSQSLSEHIADDRNTDVSQLLEDAARMQENMAQNRANYESGMANIQAIKDEFEAAQKNSSSSEPISERRDQNLNGSVTVAYSFADPVRHAVILTVPAYQCEGGGEVLVHVTLNQNGKVTSAKVTTGDDGCMQQTAISAALTSRFDVNPEAPFRHTGIIHYIFVPQ